MLFFFILQKFHSKKKKNFTVQLQLQEREKQSISSQHKIEDLVARDKRNTQLIQSLEDTSKDVRKELKEKEKKVNQEVEWYRRQRESKSFFFFFFKLFFFFLFILYSIENKEELKHFNQQLRFIHGK